MMMKKMEDLDLIELLKQQELQRQREKSDRGDIHWRSGEVKAIGLALALAVAHHILFYGHRFGISVPIFIMLYYVCMLRILNRRLTPIKDFRTFLFAVIGALSLTYVLLSNEVFYVLNSLVLPILVVIHTTLIAKSEEVRWFEFRLIPAVLDHLIPQALRHIVTPFKAVSSLLASRKTRSNHATVGKIAVGLLAAVPLLFVVTLLLSSADAMFNSIVSGFFERFENFQLSEGIFRAMTIFIVFIGFFAFAWGFIDPYRIPSDPPARTRERQTQRGLDPVIALTVLVSVNIVYVLFAAIQFSYLFGSASGELPSGMTYAENARQGFFELVAVSAINFALLAGVLTVVRSGGEKLRRAIRGVLSLLVACTAVMLVSAFIRLVLYEQVYGYTYLRFLVHAFMIYLGILIAAAGYRIWNEKLSLYRFVIAVSLTAYAAINFVGMDRIIAKQNMERYEATGEIDANYMKILSWDAVPVMIEGSKRIVELEEVLRSKYTDENDEKRSWQEFNASRTRAMHRLKAAYGEPLNKGE